MKKTYEDITRFDALDYFEIARFALIDPEVSDYIQDKLDISDEERKRLLEQLEEVLT